MSRISESPAAMGDPPMTASPDGEMLLVPHVGWLRYPHGDDVSLYIRQGWFESDEQAFWVRYLRPGDTVVDGGAHAGLFSLIAARMVGDAGRVLAVEPNPSTRALLERNIAGRGPIEIAPVALWSENATIGFDAEDEGRAAYASFATGEATRRIEVDAITPEELFATRLGSDDGSDPAPIALMKLDLEGAEPHASRGFGEALRSQRVRAAMIEFTAAHLERAGSGVAELAGIWSDAGYALRTYDAGANALKPFDPDEAGDHVNVFALADEADAGQRLGSASEEAEGIAKDIVARAAAVQTMLKAWADVQYYEKTHATLHAEVSAKTEEVTRLRRTLNAAYGITDDSLTLRTVLRSARLYLRSKLGRR